MVHAWFKPGNMALRWWHKVPVPGPLLGIGVSPSLNQPQPVGHTTPELRNRMCCGRALVESEGYPQLGIRLAISRFIRKVGSRKGFCLLAAAFRLFPRLLLATESQLP